MINTINNSLIIKLAKKGKKLNTYPDLLYFWAFRIDGKEFKLWKSDRIGNHFMKEWSELWKCFNILMWVVVTWLHNCKYSWSYAVNFCAFYLGKVYLNLMILPQFKTCASIFKNHHCALQQAIWKYTAPCEISFPKNWTWI